MCKKLQLLGTPDPLPGLCPGPHWGGLPSPEPPDWPVFILGLSGEFPNPQKFRNPPKI